MPSLQKVSFQSMQVKSQEGEEAVVLKMQVRKDEIIHGMFPNMTIGNKTFNTDALIKKDEKKSSKGSKTAKCLGTGEQDDVSQINFQPLVKIIKPCLILPSRP